MAEYSLPAQAWSHRSTAHLLPLLIFIVLLRILLSLLLLGATVVFAADPTQPPPWLQQQPEAVVQPQQPIVVQQILIRSTGNRAVINNQLVRAGDQVDGAQVVAIYPDRIVVKIRQKRHELSLLTDTRRTSE
ncbi:MAG: hypothetical protein COB09_01760 [Thalassobium sp.]|nr:MAG: hypothetical protein COB09_01760 [Thalassobium sp.]